MYHFPHFLSVFVLKTDNKEVLSRTLVAFNSVHFIPALEVDYGYIIPVWRWYSYSILPRSHDTCSICSCVHRQAAVEPVLAVTVAFMDW